MKARSEPPELARFMSVDMIGSAGVFCRSHKCEVIALSPSGFQEFEERQQRPEFAAVFDVWRGQFRWQ